MLARQTDTPIERVEVSAYTIPTDLPEGDGTFTWDSTTMVVVEALAGGARGLGYTYADTSTATLIREMLAPAVQGRNPFDTPGAWMAMAERIRNLGRPGVASMAISAVDIALWELKAKLLDLPLCLLLGRAHDAAPVYGSGGFTTYQDDQLRQQLSDWVAAGIPRVKMKVGAHPEDDLARVQAARAAIGPDAELYVDANGAYTRKQALALAEAFAALGVVWFEEPVSSDDLEGLRLIRDRAPVGMNIAAGEYGYDLWYFRRMLDAGAVDVQQADATRCGGVTSFMRVGALVEARGMALSAHCGPAAHLHVCLAIPNLWPIEYFHDHARIERMLFDGASTPRGGALYPDLARPGMGLEFKRRDAERFAV